MLACEPINVQTVTSFLPMSSCHLYFYSIYLLETLKQLKFQNLNFYRDKFDLKCRIGNSNFRRLLWIISFKSARYGNYDEAK